MREIRSRGSADATVDENLEPCDAYPGTVIPPRQARIGPLGSPTGRRGRVCRCRQRPDVPCAYPPSIWRQTQDRGTDSDTRSDQCPPPAPRCHERPMQPPDKMQAGVLGEMPLGGPCLADCRCPRAFCRPRAPGHHRVPLVRPLRWTSRFQRWSLHGSRRLCIHQRVYLVAGWASPGTRQLGFW